MNKQQKDVVASTIKAEELDVEAIARSFGKLPRVTYSAALAQLLQKPFRWSDGGIAEHPESGVKFELVPESARWNARGSEFLVKDDQGTTYKVIIDATQHRG